MDSTSGSSILSPQKLISWSSVDSASRIPPSAPRAMEAVFKPTGANCASRYGLFGEMVDGFLHPAATNQGQS